MATRERSNNNNNIKALFSIICLCIIALGLIVYFSTHSKPAADVNEATTVVETKTTQVVKALTKREVTTTKKAQTKATTTKKAKPETTEALTMETGETNTPYKSFYKYPSSEEVMNGYTEELVKNSTMGDYRAHTAIDFSCPAGSEIQAINDGLVVAIKKDSMLGTVIEIDHGGKLIARYCGMDTVNVSTNDYVTMGQTLGTTGKIPFEAESEPHFHFETKLDNKYVNPLDVMSKAE